MKGMETSVLDPDPNNKLFRIPVTILEDNIKSIPDANTKASACYILGLNYDKLGDYARAAEAFKKSYTANPKYEYADYCLFSQGYCYEKLMEQGAVPASDAKAIIMTQYSQLISKFPQSGYVPHVRSWLENNSK